MVWWPPRNLTGGEGKGKSDCMKNYPSVAKIVNSRINRYITNNSISRDNFDEFVYIFLVNVWSLYPHYIIPNLVQATGKLKKYFSHPKVTSGRRAWRYLLSSAWLALFSNMCKKKSCSAFRVCDSSLKAVTWQSGTESRAFIHLKSATPMMSVTDDYETLPSSSPCSQLWSQRAERERGWG